ncbi:MAG TPA: cobalamin-binding protein [Cyanobacteria bacterium UBA8156]|jgi:iron complex transport system substrate-binding protein|nr:cobalamin-binding protein [Cyanobacteria bacterium UBA8156]
MNTPRIVSLLPSATEILAVLGLQPYLVGRSHECDFPSGVESLPVCTAPKFDPHGDSLTIHHRVEDLLVGALSVYRLETETLQNLRPTHILTQAQCEVCAVSLGDVEAAIADWGSPSPQVISLQPTVLTEVWADIERVGAVFGRDPQEIVAGLRQQVQNLPSADPQPTVACIEWIAPLMAAGNWVPELVRRAGGIPVLGVDGKHSPWLSWAELAAADPDVVVFMPCGFDLNRTIAEAQTALTDPMWESLQAVQTGRVYATDGNAYFNRPGPRLADSARILWEIFRHDQAQGPGWQAIARVGAGG